MDNDGPSLQRRYLYKLATNLAGLLIGLVTQSIVPRTLGPASYGNYSYLTSFFWQAIGFLNLNSLTAFYAKLCQRQHDRGLVVFYLYVTFAISLSLALFIAFCYLGGIDQWVWPGQEAVFVVMAAVWALLNLYNSMFIHISDAYGLTVKSEFINMLQRVVGLALIVYLFYINRLTFVHYFILQMLLLVLVVALLYGTIAKYKSPLIQSFMLDQGQLRLYLKEFSSFCLPLTVFSLAAVLEQMLDRWFLQKFSGSVQQGYYTLAYQIGALSFLFVSALVPLIIREYAIAFSKGDFDHLRHLFMKYSLLLYTLAAYFGCFLAVESENIMLIFGGTAYAGAVIPISIMCLYPIHQTYGQLNGAFYFATARTGVYRNIGLGLIAIGLPLTFFLLGPREYGALEGGATGLAVKMVLIQCISINVQLWFNSRYLNLSFKKFMVHQWVVVLIFISIAAVSSSLARGITGHLTFYTQFVISGFVYSLIIVSLIFMSPGWFGFRREDISRLLTRCALLVHG